VLARVTTVSDRLRNLVTDLNRLFPSEVAGRSDGGSNTRGQAMERLAAEQIAAHKAAIIDELEAALEEDLRTTTTNESRELRASMGPTIRRAARTVVLRRLKAFAAETATAAFAGQHGEPLFELPAVFKAALPQRLTNCGGQQRLLVVAPEAIAPSVTPQALAEFTDALPTVIADAEADMLVCFEVEDLALNRVASAVLDQRFQAVEAASRLHTRMDVPWTPL
jgi:hypothetical protein